MRKVILVMVLLVLSAFSVNSYDMDASITNSLDVNFGGDLVKSINNETSIKPEINSLGEYIDNNLTDFTSDGSIEYYENDIVEEMNENYYDINVKLLNVAIGDDDKDGFGQGAGDIFIEGYVNGNYTRYPEIDNELQLNANENINVSVQLMNSLAFNYHISIEVRESDLDTDDSFGFINFAPNNIDNTSLVLETDTGEATLTFEITTIYKTNNVTAKQILDGNRPYMYVDDETSNTELPDDLVGRIVIGDDNGVNAMVLQYFFYWNGEYSPDGGNFSYYLHQNDFEAFYVYYDLDDFDEPYRIVFNNYIYKNISDFPGKKLLILEKGGIEGVQDYNNNITDELQFILGQDTIQTVNIMPMSEIYNWEYDTLLNKRKDVSMTSAMGAKTVELNVDTSYHTFDLGPGGEKYGFNYTEVSSLNYTRIKSWYSIIEDTINNGSKYWSFFGIDVPNVAPFTFDVKQVFNAPYVIKGFDTLKKTSLDQLKRAKNSMLNITQLLEIKVSYNFPSKIDMSYDNQFTAGTTQIVKFEYILKNEVEIIVEYKYQIQANLSFWMMQGDFKQIFEGKFEFDINTGIIKSIAEKVNLDKFMVEDKEISEYLSLSGLTFYPNIFGTIIDGSFVIDLWDLTKTLITKYTLNDPLTKTILEIIGFFIDHLELSLDFEVAGVMSVPISVSDENVQLNQTNLIFKENDMVEYVEIVIPNEIMNDFTLIIEKVSYGLNFNIEWIFGFGLISPLNKFLLDLEWSLGVYPDLISSLIDTPGGDFDFIVEKDTSTTSQDTSTTSQDTSTTSQDTSTTSQDTSASLETIGEVANFNYILGLVAIISIALRRKIIKK